MTALLAPAYALTLGTRRWTEQVLSLSVTRTFAPGVNLLAVVFPAAAPVSAAPGDDVALRIQSGEHDTVVFTGIVDDIQRRLDQIRVLCVDAGGLMARYRPAVTYEQISAGTVIRNLAGEIGAETGALADGPTLPCYVADPTRTAWEHAARLSAWGGAMARVTPDNRVTAGVIDASQPTAALRYGREILFLETGQRAAPIETFTAAGEAGAGDASAPEVFRPTTDFFAGNRPDGPSAASRWSFQPALRTVPDAATAGAARKRGYAAAAEAGRFTAFLLPHLECGTVLEIQDLPEGLAAGPVWITGLHHHLERGRTFTRVRFHKGGDSFDPAALLGSLAGALGGGL